MIPTSRATWLAVIFVVVAFGFSISNAYARLDLDTSLSVSESFTDNLFFTFANKEDDFGTFVTPSFRLTYSNKYIKLGGTYSASAQFYANNSQANNVAHGTNFDIDLPFLNRTFKRLEVRVNESLNVSPSLPAFSGNSSRFTGAGSGVGGAGGAGGAAAAGAGGAGVGGIGGIGGLSGNSLNNQGIINQRSNNTTFQNRARILLLYHFTPVWDGNVQYSNSIQFGNAFQNSLTHGIQTGLSFRLSDVTSINGGYRIQLIEFSGGSTGAGNSTSHSLNLGANHQLQPTIPIHVTTSVTVTETETSASLLNFTGSGEISKIFPEGEISLRLNQGIGTGGGLAASTTLNQNAVLTASKTFTRFVSGFLHFGYSRNRSLSGRTVETDTYQFRGGANLRLLEWLSGGVTYSYTNQDSQGSVGNTASSNTIFVGLTGTAETFSFFK